MYKTKKCIHCGKKINVKYVICPICGGQASDKHQETAALCPRCNVNLEIHLHDNEEYDICPECGGIWLDKDEFHRATVPYNIYRELKTRERFLRTPPGDPVKYIPCVRCGKIMHRKNFARISGVIIDECSMHGVWLDAGEMEKIRLFIVDGGLEKAQNREIEKTRAELKDLATRVQQTAFTHKLIHFWNFKRWFFGG